MPSVLFVCLGNICRSPTAEAVFRGQLEDAGLTEAISVDSAGTGDWHVGASPDTRSAEAAARRGVTLTGHGRQVTPADLDAFDHVIAMDAANEADLLDLAGADPTRRAKVRRLRELDPQARTSGDLDVPDPYSGGAEGFELVLDVVERGCAGLLEELQAADPA